MLEERVGVVGDTDVLQKNELLMNLLVFTDDLVEEELSLSTNTAGPRLLLEAVDVGFLLM